MAKNTQRTRRLAISDHLTLGKNALIRKRSGNDYVTIDPLELALLDGITATTAEINSKCDVSTLHEAVTTTNVISAAETGKHFILNSATGFISTLPTPAIGLEFFFHIGATEPTTSHTVVTGSSTNIIVGNITSPEDAAGSVATVTDADTISFVANLAVHGDYAHVYSDGTNWYLDGMCKVQDGMTTTQAS
jgi:hypothetical protein